MNHNSIDFEPLARDLHFPSVREMFASLYAKMTLTGVADYLGVATATVQTQMYALKIQRRAKGARP
jgi:hypothetical protein